MKSLSLCVFLLAAVGCGSSGENGPSFGASSTVELEGGRALPDSAFYFIKDAETGLVRETVVIAHNLSNHCPDGCTIEALGTPVDGGEMRLLKLAFEGEVQEGVFQQGAAFIQASINVGEAGCGVPSRIGPDGRVVEEGHPPGYDRHESVSGEVTVAHVSAENIEVQIDVQFEIGEITGTADADHCAALDAYIIE